MRENLCVSILLYFSPSWKDPWGKREAKKVAPSVVIQNNPKAGTEYNVGDISHWGQVYALDRSLHPSLKMWRRRRRNRRRPLNKG